MNQEQRNDVRAWVIAAQCIWALLWVGYTLGWELP